MSLLAAGAAAQGALGTLALMAVQGTVLALLAFGLVRAGRLRPSWRGRLADRSRASGRVARHRAARGRARGRNLRPAAGGADMTRALLRGALAAALVVALVWLLPFGAVGIALIEWVRGAGPVAVVAFAAVYVGSAVALVPASALTLGAGFVYGPVWGGLLVVATSNAAALISFGLARQFGRGWIARRVQAEPRFGAIDRAVARAGGKITLLLRLSPVFPFGLLNYALGLTAVSPRAYAVATALGMLPGTLLYVYLGSLLTSATALGARPQHGLTTVMYWGGLGFAAVSVSLITWIARRALRLELAKEPA